MSPSILPTPSLSHKKVYITTCNNTHILFLLYKLNTLSCFYFYWSFVTRKRNRTLMKYENLLENMTKKVWKVMYVHPLQSNIKKNNINYTEHMHQSSDTMVNWRHFTKLRKCLPPFYQPQVYPTKSIHNNLQQYTHSIFII